MRERELRNKSYRGGGSGWYPARLIALALVALFSTTAGAQEDAQARKTIALLRANLAPLRDLTADVTVETKMKRLWTEQLYRQRYTYAFKKPSFIRIEFLEPAGDVLIAKGKTVWKNGKRTRGRAVPDESASPLSLWALTVGAEELYRDYTVTSFREPARPRLSGLQLVPKGRAVTAASVRVWVDTERGVVDQVKVFGAKEKLLSTSTVSKFERIGQLWLPVTVVTYGCDGRCKTTIVYKNVKLNSGLPDSLFTPKRE